MKICFVSDYLPGVHNIWSGGEIVCLRLSEALEKKGHEVVFLTTYGHDGIFLDLESYKKTGLNNKILLIKTPLLKLGVFGYVAPFDFLCFLYAVNILKTIKPDIIHFHAKILFLPVLIAAKLLRIPTIYTVVDYNIICPKNTLRRPDGEICTTFQGNQCFKCTGPRRRPAQNGIEKMLAKAFVYRRRLIHKYAIKNISALITFTQTSKSKLIKYGIPPEKIKVIYQYELAFEESTSLISEDYFKTPTILFLGALHEHKGLGVVVEAMKYITKDIPDTRLLVIGSAWNNTYLDKVNNMIQEFSLQNNVTFLGQRENREVMEIINKTDVVVVPEQWPSDFGPVILVEALGMGNPVVASKIGAIPEFIQDGFNGFLVDQDKPEQFANKIVLLLKHKELLKEFSENARKSSEFLRDGSLARRVTTLYNSVIKPRKKYNKY